MESTGRFTRELRHLMARSYDVCQSCSHRLEKETPALAGYDADGGPLYVGPCCEGRLAERATHVYWWWEVDKRCAPNLPIWRYMDFARFVALLEDRALHFARADTLGDRYEGAAGIAEQEPHWDAFYRDFFRRAVANPPEGAEGPPREVVDREAERLLRDFKALGERDRLRSFASCWHASSVESEALWRLYCPPPATGVAIRTTVDALDASLGRDPSVRIGKVQYVDFRHGFAGLHDRIFWKRKSLSHEAEVRAVIQKGTAQRESGWLMRANLATLLLGVVPSPFAPLWFPELVSKTLVHFGVKSGVETSELLSEPFF